MSDLDKQKLVSLYHEKGLGQREIAERFGVTQPYVSRKMDELGVESEYTGFWTEEEVGKVKQYYPDKSEKLTSELNRTWNAIKHKAMELGFARNEEEYQRSDEVVNRLNRLSEERTIELDFENHSALSYLLGVTDGDGYHDNEGTIGLEVKSEKFAKKFMNCLRTLGLNPGQGTGRGKIQVWASSKKLVEWLMSFDYDSKQEWLKRRGDCWKYIEGVYDSDGNFSNSGPRICSYDEAEKKFLKSVIECLGLEASIHSNNVYISSSSKDQFFKNIDPVYEKRRP
ncbi:MAG: hypothetical protein ABEJ07_01435 [Candidatus Nanohaloarchaea archaeon]